jgi:uncharacterized protein YkwD
LFRIRTLFAAALSTLVVGASAPAAANSGQRGQMVRAINFVRGWSHRRSLDYSDRLSGGAAAWARSLMRRDVLAHSGNARARHEGEVIEWHTGSRSHINGTVMAWLASPAHKAVMLARGYRRAGAGKAVGSMNGQRSVIWVVRFAR